MQYKKIKWLLPLIFMIPFVLSTGCAYYNTFYNAKKFYRQAEKEREKREKSMVVELTEEEKANRRKTGRSTNMADKPSQKEMQNYQISIEKSSRVLEFFPNSKYVDDALILLGKCFYYRQEYIKAQRKFNELQQLYPESEFIPESELFMAKTSLGLEEFDLAEEQFMDITYKENFPKDLREEAKFELANLYYEQMKYEQAAENFTSSSREADNKLIRAMSIYKLGECNIKMEQFEEAVNLFRSAVKASPNEDFKSQAMFKLGEAQGMRKDYDKAIETYTRLLNTEYDVNRIPKIKLALAQNMQKKGDLEDAIKWYNNIIEDHKNTDASARSYFALGQMEEFINKDYQKAKDNYDLVRSAFSNSLIAPDAKERSDYIKMLLELNKDIAKLEGRYVETDSTDGEGIDGEGVIKRDDKPIDLPDNGFWINYAGRHRPPPTSLIDLTEADMQRSAAAAQLAAASADSSDSSAVDLATQPVVMDSAAIAEMQAKQKAQKQQQLAEKRLALAEILYFNFEMPDSAINLYQTVIANDTDSSLTTRALYSLGYLYHQVKQDSIGADSVLHKLLVYNPESDQANGARKLLGIMPDAPKVDSAKIYYNIAEQAWLTDQNPDKAIELYEYILNHFPDSPYAPKAEYARGWLYEQVLFKPDEAMAIYENFIEAYPETEYTKKIQDKLAAVEKVIKEQEAREKAIADSLQKAEQAKMDSLAALSTDSTGTMVSDSLMGQAISDSTLSDSLNAGGQTDPLLMSSDEISVRPDSLAEQKPDSVNANDARQNSNKRPETRRDNRNRGRTPAEQTQTLPPDSINTETATKPEEDIVDQ